MAETTETDATTARRGRSPSFPFIPLETATARLEELEVKFGRHPVPVQKAGLAWNMKEGSSQASQTLAALKSFGFITYEGSGNDRKAVLTEDARTYLRAQQDQIKKGIVREAALKPKEIAKYWTEWRADPPIDPVRLDELILQANYTDEGAKTFLRVYDDTIAFAGLSDSDKIQDEDVSDIDADEPRHTENERRRYQDRREQTPLQRRQLEPGMKEATFPLAEGIGVVQWPEPLSEESYAMFEQFVQLALIRAKSSISKEPSKPQGDAEQRLAEELNRNIAEED